MSIENPKPKFLCYGEVLWDSLPEGIFLGGAPFNVACHLHQLDQEVRFASRVGNDQLGREIRRRMEARGMSASLLQSDEELETGFVRVSLDKEGSPTFEIVRSSAWDFIEPNEPLLDAAKAASFIIFGTLVQREKRSRTTLQRIWESTATKVLDINLRPPYVDRTIVEESLKAAQFVKLNAGELQKIKNWYGWSGEERELVVRLSDEFECPTVCLTRGEEGALLYREGKWSEQAGIKVEVRDAVGAGDAFLAGLLSRLSAGEEPADALAFANALAAFVASKNGATPALDLNTVDQLMKSIGS